MPTLLGLAGVPIPASVEGLDFCPHIRGGAAPGDGATVLMCVAPFGEYERGKGGREYRGLRTARHTYVRDLSGPWLLFDNDADPYQQNNLINNPAHAVTGIRNADLRQRLPKHHGEKRTDRQLTASATRHLRLLRAHGIIKKISKTHRYQLTDHGRTLVTAMTSALAASTKKLTKIAA